MNQFPIEYAKERKPKPDPKTLVFGHSSTDHMFLMNYDAGQGWHDGRIVPYGPLQLEPSSMVFHYAQEVFEGMKASAVLTAGCSSSVLSATPGG